MKHFILLLFIGLMASATTVAQSDTSENWDKVFVKVEKEAVFPGGAKGWSEYLAKNLNVNTAADAGAKAGVYTVKVQFLVGADGTITKAEAIEVPKKCKPCAVDAIRVIKNSPPWEPAYQNHRPVIYMAVQSISYRVDKE